MRFTPACFCLLFPTKCWRWTFRLKSPSSQCWARRHDPLGPLLGSVILESSAEIFKTVFKEAHLLIYGVLIVVVVLFMPEGVVGTVSSKLGRFKKAPLAPFAAPAPVAAQEETSRAALNE